MPQQPAPTLATILQINVSDGGVPKRPVPEAQVGERGITIDRQADLKYHGSPDQALCLYPIEAIEALQAEGHSITAGASGENITTHGLEWRRVLPGSRLRLGDAVLIQITDFASPCVKNAQWFSDGDFSRLDQQVNPGMSRVYAKVLEGGVIRPGDPVVLLEASAAERADRRRIKSFRWPADFQRQGADRP